MKAKGTIKHQKFTKGGKCYSVHSNTRPSIFNSLRVYLVNMYPKLLYFSFCDVFFTVTFFRLSWYPKKSSGLLRYKKPEILLVLLVNSFLRVIGKPVVKNRNSVINRPYWMQRSIESEYANYDS